MKYILLIFIFWTSYNLTAQKKVNATVGLESDITDFNLEVGIGYPQLDSWIPFQGAPYIQSSYAGYSFYILTDNDAFKIPVHVEEGDDFDLVLDKDMLLANVYYKGAAGAVKNNYLLSRYFFVKEQELKPDFLKNSKEELLERINTVQDSMMTLASGLNLSDGFIRDEVTYWNFYKQYLTTFYDILKAPELSGYYALPLALEEYPVLEYDEAYYYQYRHYFILFTQRQIARLDAAPTVKLKNDIFKELRRNSSARFQLLNWVAIKIKLRDNDAIYSKVYRRNIGFYQFEVDRTMEIFMKNRRFAKNLKFPQIQGFDHANKPVNLSTLGKDKTAIYLLRGVDRHMKSNLSKWNTFYVDTKNEYKQFVILTLDADLNSELLKTLARSESVAGEKIGVNFLDGISLLNTINQQVLPAVITVEDHKITNFNTLPKLLFNDDSYAHTIIESAMPRLGTF